MKILRGALVSGTLAAAAVTLAASFAARRATGSAASALNATSHFLWGERAARKEGYSLKYTATGFMAGTTAPRSSGPSSTKRWVAASAAGRRAR
jgi:hypothetical protein